MKKLSVLLVTALVVAMMMGFVGCKQEADTPAAPSAVTTWEYSEDGMTSTVYLYSDGTWKVVYSMEGMSVDAMTGTYSGDSTKNGTLTGKITYVNKEAVGGDTFKEGDPILAVIQGNTMTFTFGGSEGVGGMDLTKK